MRPDKKKVVDEQWDDARIDEFLAKAPMGDEPAQYSVLLNAYRSMRLEDFERFLPRYLATGGDLNARSAQGRTLAEEASRHRHGEVFAQALRSLSA